MRIHVLGCSGSEFPDRRPPAYLIDDTLLLDAGTICSALSIDDQRRIDHILLTHPHLDHIRGIPPLADNIVTSGNSRTVTIHALPETIDVLSAHIMNGTVWPDFSRIPPDRPVIRYEPVSPGVTFTIDGCTVTPLAVPHAVPAVGYLLEKGGKRLFYTGDTGPLPPGFWDRVGALDTLIIEASFPDDQEELALLTGHLTPALLHRELEAMGQLPAKIGVVHLKPLFHDRIDAELDRLPLHGIRVLTENERFVG